MKGFVAGKVEGLGKNVIWVVEVVLYLLGF